MASEEKKKVIEGETSTGFPFSIPVERLDNMELIDALSDLVHDEDTLAVSTVLRLLLGKDQRKQLYDHVRVNGRVPSSAVFAELKDILSYQTKELKN